MNYLKINTFNKSLDLGDLNVRLQNFTFSVNHNILLTIRKKQYRNKCIREVKSLKYSKCIYLLPRGLTNRDIQTAHQWSGKTLIK